CNAGFDLMGEATGEYSSLVSYVGDPVVNLTIMTLIVIGGIGFVVWDDVRNKGLCFHSYKLQTKIVVTLTAVLIFGGAGAFWLLEREHLMANMTVSESVFASLFSSVTARTAGFNTIDTGALTSGSKLLTIVLMFIGGSPGSTAGGIKTTTIMVLVMYAISTLSNQSGCNVFDRRVPEDMVRKAGVVLILNLGLAITAGVLICGLQPHIPMDSVLFEVFSAIGTVGMSTGITRELGTASRYIIIFLMYCGRIGSMTFALSFTRRKNVNPVQLPVGHLPVG
ncbi:MAG: TrkH family potassium uptake protein, partial [Lachnospiraceae bacterium]